MRPAEAQGRPPSGETAPAAHGVRVLIADWTGAGGVMPITVVVFRRGARLVFRAAAGFFARFGAVLRGAATLETARLAVVRLAVVRFALRFAERLVARFAVVFFRPPRAAVVRCPASCRRSRSFSLASLRSSAPRIRSA